MLGTFYVVSCGGRILPTISPQNKKLEEEESVRQGKTETFHEERNVVQFEMCDYVSILIILHYY